MDTKASALALCMTTREMGVVWCDDAYTDLLHRERLDLLGSNVIDHTHPDHRSINLKLLDSLRSGGPAFSLTKRYLRADGASVWVRNHVSAINDGAGPQRLLATVEKLLVLENDEAVMLDRAERAIRRRRARMTHLQRRDIKEGAVDILLDLFVHYMKGKQVYVSSACLAARVPPTTALRHIDQLIAAGLVGRHGDPADRRRLLLHLTEEGIERIKGYLRLCET